MIIQHNISAMGTATQLGRSNRTLAKSINKLASGYAINGAADNAAGLQISEKMRSQIRGLKRAAQNADDGVGFIQTGDGAINEINSILQRMRELAVQSSNDTYTDQDRAVMQLEFDQLQGEIDRINDQTEFNTLPVFEHYADTYYNYQGSHYWSQDQLHNITDETNTLTVKYQITEEEAPKEISFSIPNGTYTTQELMDTMDDVITEMGDRADGLYLEYNKDGYCNMVLQNGEKIISVSNGLSYLFYDTYQGSKVGSLIGTTVFDPNFPLIVNENNNELKFTIEYYNGTSRNVSINIDEGLYSRQDMIDYLNQALSDTGMQASEYGDYSIQLGGDSGLITGLKGNMFLIDDPGQVMVSVFYDNTKYGGVEKRAGSFTGGAVLNTSDKIYNRYVIDNTNQNLSIRIDGQDGDSYTTLSIPEGSYSMTQMVAELRQLFQDNGVNAFVGSYVDYITSPNGNFMGMQGLTITSNHEGTNSKVEILESSSAYDTLFVTQKYTDEGNVVSESSGSYSYIAPVMTGGKDFTIPGNLPVNLDDTNRFFQLLIRDTYSGNETYTFSLPAGDYRDLNELITAINNQLGSVSELSNVKDKIQAVAYDGAIRFIPKEDNRSVMGISVTGKNTEPYATGYKTLFEGQSITYSLSPVTSTSVNPSVTLDPVDETTVYDSTNNKLTVDVGGEQRTVVVPEGTHSAQELTEIITEQLKGKTVTSPNNYNASGRGTTIDRNVNTSASGSVQRNTSILCNVAGTGGAIDGTTTVVDAKPATYTIPISLPAATIVDDENNSFTLTVNSRTYTVQLDDGIYTPAALAQALNNKLDDAVPSSTNKVNVTLDDENQLVFTTAAKGSSTSLSFSDTTSSFLMGMTTTKTPATLDTGLALQNNISIDDSSNAFTCTVDGQGHTVTVPNGTYTKNSFLAALNQALSQDGAEVTASTSGGTLVLTTNEANGTASTLTFDSRNGGSACEAMFGELFQEAPAEAVLSSRLEDPIEIDDTTNSFSVRLSEAGQPEYKTVTIPNGSYSPGEMAALLDNLFGDEISVALNSNNSLTFTTAAKGSDVTIAVSNAISGSAGKALFGESSVTTPDVTASITPEGNLQLSGSSTGSAYTISVTPKENSPFLEPAEISSPVYPSSSSGYFYEDSYRLESYNYIYDDVEITSDNNTFHFTYNTPNGTVEATVVVPDGTYNAASLKAALQDKINDMVGDGKISVSLEGGTRITISLTHTGSDYYLSDFSGGFYDHVLNNETLQIHQETPRSLDGYQVVSDTYIIGRQDVKNEPVIITEDITDKLSFDVTINNVVHTLSMTLDPGIYDSDSLVKMIQEKIDEQLIQEGLPEHSVLVDVGLFDSGVVGANDANALDFYLNKDIDLDPGTYKIDGLTGNSLFKIFYKTTGDPIPAYITGTKDISEGVEILPDQTELNMDLDGVTHAYEIPAGNYETEEFLTLLNTILSQPDKNGNIATLTASLSGKNLKISEQRLGEHAIENVTGSAAPEVFNEAGGRKDYDSSLWLQVGANSMQLLDLNRYSFSTLNLGINSLTVSKWSNAQKALGRLDKAISLTNSRRSNYGAQQNRLDHTISINNNTGENMQSSESLIRDTDMASEMVTFARQRILSQAAFAMLSQARSQPESVLRLLQ